MELLQPTQDLSVSVLVSACTYTPPTHPDKYEGDEIEQNLENESCLSVWVDPKNVFEPCPNLKNSQIRAKNFSISFFLC